MKQEEKARRYDESMGRAKKELDACGSQDCEAARQIFRLFPELKESDDEKIIKSMTRLVKAFYDCNFPTPEGFERKDMLAWLEKQVEQKSEEVYNLHNYLYGKQKPADKVEPKFKVGDEIKTANEESLTITKIDEKGYWSEDLFICDFNEECLWNLVKKKTAWSEEDEKMIEHICYALPRMANGNIEILPSVAEEYVERLKSLRPQNTWKPNEEHIHWLKWAINRMPDTEKANEAEAVLEELLEQLKKLMEE